jgi:hypothetical protein
LLFVSRWRHREHDTKTAVCVGSGRSPTSSRRQQHRAPRQGIALRSLLYIIPCTVDVYRNC